MGTYCGHIGLIEAAIEATIEAAIEAAIEADTNIASLKKGEGDRIECFHP